MQSTYVQVHGNYQPINIVASGNIKCMTCGKFIDSHNIQQHHSLHIKPKFLIPQSDERPIEKLKISQSIMKQLNKQSDDIFVRSMIPSQLPQKESDRKRIFLQNNDQQISNIDISSVYNDIRIDKKDVSSNISNTQFCPEDIDILPIQTTFQLTINQASVSRKQIHVYQNSNKLPSNLDHKSERKKLRQPLQELTKNQYPYEITEINQKKQDIPQEKSQQQKIKVRYLRIPPVNIVINTKKQKQIEKYQETLKSQSDQVHTRKIDDQPSFTRYNGQCNCKCPCCGGFYCSVCNSSIPPKYRPVPSKQKLHNEEQIKNFWDKYHANKSLNCKNCSK